MQESTIKIDIGLGDDRIPEKISWQAPGSTADTAQQAKSMMLAFWDSRDKTALRVDLWTKDMMVDEMGDFFYQTFKMMADTFDRATHQEELVQDIKQFAEMFHKKFRAIQLKDSKA